MKTIEFVKGRRLDLLDHLVSWNVLEGESAEWMTRGKELEHNED